MANMSVSGTTNAYGALSSDNKPKVSGTTSAYDYQSYTVESNDKNTLTTTDFLQLLAVQLQNQDVTEPMDTGEMMQSMMQMGMMNAIDAMTNAVNSSSAISTQTYAASLMGQEVTVIVTEENSFGKEVAVDVKYAKVEYVTFVNGTPYFKVEGDNKEYLLSDMVGVGRIPNPFAQDIEIEKDPEDPENPENPEGTEETGPAEPEGES